jgi:hypothetical protein
MAFISLALPLSVTQNQAHTFHLFLKSGNRTARLHDGFVEVSCGESAS